jgi:maltoporin
VLGGRRRDRLFLDFLESACSMSPLRMVFLFTVFFTTAAHGQRDGFRFQGYLRSGFGVAGTGDPQEAFRAPNAGAKYRLGNETEAYLETIFGYGLTPKDDSTAFFDTRINISYVTPTSNSNDFETTTALREAFVVATGVWKAQADASFWAGQRYFDRHNTNINDFFYRDLSGFGGGVDSVRLGRGPIHAGVAWLGGSVNQLESNGNVPPTGSFQLSKNTFDFRLYGLPLAGGRLGVALDLALVRGDTVPFAGGDIVVLGNSGWALSALHERRLASGRNKLSLQYGTGAASDFRAVLTQMAGRPLIPGDQVDYDDVWQFRVVEDLVLDRLGPISLQVAGIWQELDNGLPSGGRMTWVSLGARPGYQLSRYFSLELETGFDYTRQADSGSGSLMKITLAPQITPGFGALTRPSLRAYVTWAGWSDRFVGRVAPAVYGAERRGFAAGVQIETWW